MTKLSALVPMTLIAALLAVGCGADGPGIDGSTTASTKASVAYTQKCARCHGPKGVSELRVDKDAGLRPMIPPALPGRLALPTYIGVVREGRPPEMPAYTAAEIGDADMASDFEWMKTKP